MNDKEIKINGLTTEQVEMLDLMWMIESYLDYEEWLQGLSRADRIMAEELQRLLIIEAAEQLIQDEDLSSVKSYLRKFQLKK